MEEWVAVVNSEKHSVHADVLQCQGQKSVSDRNMTELEEHLCTSFLKTVVMLVGGGYHYVYHFLAHTQEKSVAIYPSVSPHLLVIIQKLLTRFSFIFKLGSFTEICQYKVVLLKVRQQQQTLHTKTDTCLNACRT